MIVVAGEALMDLVVTGDDIVAVPGGAPFNVAIGCSRLGAPVALLAAVSTDGFGARLVARLADAGVSDAVLQRTDRPTTLALADVDAAGVASYRFYTDGTSAPSLADVDVHGRAMALPDGCGTLVTGGLGLVLEPMASAIESLVVSAPADVMVVVDVNCRPAVITDRAAYVARVHRVLARADVVKVSDEDLEFLTRPVDPEPDVSSDSGARALLDAGARVVLITRGGSATTIVTPDFEVDVPVEPVTVVDTIGAGDAFTAGFVTWCHTNMPARADLEPSGTNEPVATGETQEALLSAVRAAHAAAARVVAHRGADFPPQSF